LNQGAVMLPNMFTNDFGDQVQQFATLIDAKSNQFEVLVERIDGSVLFSKGWKSLRGFYGINLGVWVSLIFVDQMKFVIKLKDKLDKVIKPPVFDPPMHFMIDKTNVETTFDPNLPPFTPLISYHHDVNKFQIEFVKKLTEFDVAKEFLVWKMFVVSIFIFTSACLFLLGC